MNRVSLADSPVTLSGALHQVSPTAHLPLTPALQLSLDVVRLVADAHDKGRVIGVLDAAHLICLADGMLKVGGTGGDPISPELKRGDRPDRLSDVYALGALIYRLLTGRKVDPLRFIEPPSHFNPAVDTGLDELVLEALDDDPSERPYSARELEQRLLRIFDDLGLEATSRAEASSLLKKSVTKYRSPVRFTDAEETQDDEDGDVARPQGLGGFLNDLGWSPGKPQRCAFVSQDDGDDEPRKTRNKLSQFLYDLGWLQSIDWDAPETLTWLKRGGIALGVLLLLVVVWPSHRKPAVKPPPGAASAAVVAAAVKADPKPIPRIVKPVKTASRR